MPIRFLAVLLFLAVIFGLPIAFVSAQSPTDSPVHIIELSSCGYDHGLAVAFSPDGGQIAIGTSSGIALYNSRSLFREQFIETGTWSRSLVYSPDGQIIAAGLFDGTARSWQLSDGNLLQVFEGHTGWVRSVVFSRDGKHLITAADDDSVRVWNTSDGSLELTISPLAGVRVVALSPDDLTLAVGLQDSSIQLLDVSNGSVLKTLTGHEDWVRSLAFSPDGTKLASGAFDATARLWDVETGRLEYTLSDHQSSVLGLAFSPDESTLATGSVDATVKLWDAADGGLIRTLVGHTDFVYGVAFSPDGTVLASTAGDNTARVWNVSIPETNPVPQPSTSSDCRDCHHPRGVGAPPRVIQVSCEACHAGGIGLNWCPFFPRAAQVISEVSYIPPQEPVGVPVSSENIAVHINYPTNGETLYSTRHHLSPVFVAGRVFYRGDRGDIEVRMEIWSGGQLTKELFTQAEGDGSFTFDLAINPTGALIVAGAKAADPDCAYCHEDFKSQGYFPDGKIHLVITAISPDGDQAFDERWITVDTSDKASVDIRVLDTENSAPIPGLSVHAKTILYEWRDRYSNQVSDAHGVASLPLEALSQAVTRHEITVPPTSLNGYLYKSVAPVILEFPPGTTIHEPVTIFVDVRTGRITGKLSGVQLSDSIDIWAVHLPEGIIHKASASDGIFRFYEMPSGKYLVFPDPAIEQLGIHVEPIHVDLTKQAQADISFDLKQTAAGSISGRLYEENGRILPFGWITAGLNKTSQLDPVNGNYRLFGLNPQRITVVADVPGYYSQAVVMDLSDEQERSLDFALVRRPETTLLPWGDGRVTLPSETVYELRQGTIALENGWIWGENAEEDALNLQVGGMNIVVRQGSFALEYFYPKEGWFYLVDGEAILYTVDGQEIRLNGTQMTALSDLFTPLPVPYEETTHAIVHLDRESPLQNKWEPSLEAQIRDRLARAGITIVQFVTFVTYMLVLIVIASTLIGGIYSTWKNIKS
jgi:hypothetical protein